ncbi:MAG TPA: S1C family serine protease [Capillimicrobium sp.]|nr:S1C family serine protease [Capillimicrobium sp.]
MSSTALLDLADRVGPAVVGLRGTARARWRGGSGFVMAPGVAVTLARNVRGADELTLRTAAGDVAATVTGTDRTVDLAVLTFDRAAADVPSLPWAIGDGDAAAGLRIGTPVFAFGDPGGQGLRATAGAIASAPRTVRGPAGRLIDGTLEHTAPLPRGSGGGPLVDEHGRVLGLNALRPAPGLLLAWPATALRERAEALVAGRSTAPPVLGVALADARQTRRLRAAVGLEPVDGLLVRDVQDGSAAARAGVERGDVLVSLGGRPIAGVDDLFAALDAAEPGPVDVGVVRGAETLTLTLELAGAGA